MKTKEYARNRPQLDRAACDAGNGKRFAASQKKNNRQLQDRDETSGVGHEKVARRAKHSRGVIRLYECSWQAVWGEVGIQKKPRGGSRGAVTRKSFRPLVQEEQVSSMGEVTRPFPACQLHLSAS